MMRLLLNYLSRRWEESSNLQEVLFERRDASAAPEMSILYDDTNNDMRGDSQ